MKPQTKSFLLLLLASSVFLFGCTSASQTAITDSNSAMEKNDSPMDATPVDSMMKKNVIRYSKAAFDEAIASKKPVIVNVHANWCPICNAFAPAFDQTASKLSGQVIFMKAHWQDEETSADDKSFFAEYGISGQHTLIQFNPAEVKRSREAFTQSEFEEWSLN